MHPPPDPTKSALDEEWARGRLREWLGLRQAMKGGFELHYEYCEPRIVCERFLRDGTGGLRDYKFMVFDGVVQFAFTVDRRAGLAMRGTYLPDWTRAPFEYTCEAVRAPDVPPPSGLETMLRLASRLGKGFACARVDFYQVRGRVYFGEITFTDADGLSEFAPARYNRIFGDRIVLPEKKSFKGIIL
ncbi:ATP-grasp fold amidoligase family protein [Actinomyces sp. HMT 175]|uniref:ATP-grasp fold amidoligase family protein n=1 Tax=Actinomyces sp. HMT 175 TaxID=2789425 RepID=UPI001F2E5D41|nr:ATP-grasp fold amidoligase family protein [Actinomyces sp. HMT 175]